jgi:large subunit ribosomal protein L29
MALSKMSDIRALSDQEVADGIVAIKRELFELRLQQATNRLEKTHQFKHARHKLAQLMTVESERKSAQAPVQAK